MSKICLDLTPLQSEHKHRGIGRYARELINAHLMQNKSLEIFAGVSSLGETPAFEMPKIEYFKPEVPKYHFQWLWSFVLLRRKLIESNIQLIHSTDHQCIPKKGPYMRLFTVHDLIPLVYRDIYYSQKSPDEKLGYDLYLNSIQNADHLLAISNQTKNDLVNFLNINDKKISVIPNGVNIEVFSDEYREETDKVNLKRILGDYSKNYYLYVGSAEKHKNLRMLIKGFKIVQEKYNNNFKLCIVGKWSEAQLDDLIEVTREENVKNVIHLGYVSFEELNCLYRNCISFVFPSLYEGFGLPVLEAMASGAPVITSDISVFKEISYEGALHFNPEDYNKLAELMEALYNNRALKNEHKFKGKEHVKKFTWNNTSKKTLDLYEKLLTGRC